MAARPSFQGPFRLNWLLRVKRTRAQPPPPPPPPSTSPTSSEATLNASPPLIPSHSSSETTPTASLPVPPPRAANKRKAEESLLPESDSDGDAKKMKRGGISSSSSAAAVFKVVTLEEIRALPQSAKRPFYPRNLRRGTRSIKEPKPWKCSMCGHVNGLTHHLVFDLPAFTCKACGAKPSEADTDFGFCFADLAVNETCPIGHVKMQRPVECIANTLLSCVEITHRIMATILQQPLSKEGPYIDINDLLLKYEKRWIEEGNEKMDTYSGLSLLIMIYVFQVHGVKEKKTSGLHEEISNESHKLHKVSDWVWVDQNDFVAVSSALADGYPLICLFKTGPRLAYLKPGEIYVPPSRGSIGGHAALLVGAEQEGKVKFLYFLTSAGERFCKRSNSNGHGIRGGIGAIKAGHFDFDLIQIFRFNERKTQAVQHQLRQALEDHGSW